MCGKAVAFLGPEQPERAWAQRWVPARAKRRGGEGGGTWSRGRRPLYVEVNPYGSDTWRLDPIIQLLQDGAVRNGQPAGVGLPCSACVHACWDASFAVATRVKNALSRRQQRCKWQLLQSA